MRLEHPSRSVSTSPKKAPTLSVKCVSKVTKKSQLKTCSSSVVEKKSNKNSIETTCLKMSSAGLKFKINQNKTLINQLHKFRRKKKLSNLFKTKSWLKRSLKML